jgi:hypothetical protein
LFLIHSTLSSLFSHLIPPTSSLFTYIIHHTHPSYHSSLITYHSSHSSSPIPLILLISLFSTFISHHNHPTLTLSSYPSKPILKPSPLISPIPYPYFSSFLPLIIYPSTYTNHHSYPNQPQKLLTTYNNHCSYIPQYYLLFTHPLHSLLLTSSDHSILNYPPRLIPVQINLIPLPPDLLHIPLLLTSLYQSYSYTLILLYTYTLILFLPYHLYTRTPLLNYP